MPEGCYAVVLEHGHGARIGRVADVVGAGAAGVDAGDWGVGGRGGEEVSEYAFGHWGAADVTQADEEDGGW